MLTFDGEYVGPETDNAPSLAAIALALGRQPRWSGRSEKPFNVLAHSFLVSELVGEGYSTDALLHDAAEAVVGDIPTNWKTDADRKREEGIMRRIYRRLGRSWPLAPRASAAIKRADTLALRLESTLLMPRAIASAPAYAVRPITQFHRGWLLLPKAEFWIAAAQKPEDWIYPDSKWVRKFCEILEDK